MSLDEIYNARPVDDRLLTSGQLSGDQLCAVAAAGVDTVINLAPHDSRNALSIALRTFASPRSTACTR